MGKLSRVVQMLLGPKELVSLIPTEHHRKNGPKWKHGPFLLENELCRSCSHQGRQSHSIDWNLSGSLRHMFCDRAVDRPYIVQWVKKAGHPLCEAPWQPMSLCSLSLPSLWVVRWWPFLFWIQVSPSPLYICGFSHVGTNTCRFQLPIPTQGFPNLLP